MHPDEPETAIDAVVEPDDAFETPPIKAAGTQPLSETDRLKIMKHLWELSLETTTEAGKPGEIVVAFDVRKYTERT